MKVALAELLLRRKELAEKVQVTKNFKADPLFERKVVRKTIAENLNIDEITMQIPKLDLGQVTAEFDWHARQLRLISAAI